MKRFDGKECTQFLVLKVPIETVIQSAKGKEVPDELDIQRQSI